jgi:hypothetical protein
MPDEGLLPERTPQPLKSPQEREFTHRESRATLGAMKKARPDMGGAPRLKGKNSGSKRLTPMQSKLVKNLAKGMSITDAALEAGYSENCPAQSGSQALDAIRRKMPELLDRTGLTEEGVIEKYLKPLMNAKEMEFAKFEGKITDARSVVAWGPRAQGLDMYFRLRGSYAPTRLGSPNGDDPIQVKVIDTAGMREAGPMPEALPNHIFSPF